MSIYQYNGKQYGIPWDMGMIGFWYNKDAVRAGRHHGPARPPGTSYLAAVDKLKAAGITPLAIAGKDKWPSMHLWTYLVLRNGGGDALSPDDPDRRLEHRRLHQGRRGRARAQRAQSLPGRLQGRDVYNDEAAAVGNGKAAMELMGQWAPSVQKDQSADKKGLGDNLGWFAFPAVTGGAGAATDGVGGGNGIAVGKDAPPEAIDFLKFFIERRERQQAQHRRRRPLDDRRHREHRHRPEPAGRPRRPRPARSSCSCTSTRRPARTLGQTFNDATMALFAGAVDPREGVPGDHRRRGHPVGRDLRVRRS